MNVEIETEAAQFPEKEYMNGISFALLLMLLGPPDAPPAFAASHDSAVVIAFAAMAFLQSQLLLWSLCCRRPYCGWHLY